MRSIPSCHCHRSTPRPHIIMLLRPLFFLLARFLQVLATTNATAQTTITSDPSTVSNHHFDYVCTLGNSTNDVSSNIDRLQLQIIAGGGLSGLVVANKLSGKGYSVLVVEYVLSVFVVSSIQSLLNTG